MPIDINDITPRHKLTIAKGLCDYQFIMENWQTQSEDFKSVYYEFYLKARWSVMTKPENSHPYFNTLQSIPLTGDLTNDLMSILEILKNDMAKQAFEFSLSTKLLHTRNPSAPIYDRKVREYLSTEENVEFWWARNKNMFGNSAPRGTSECEKIKHDWRKLCEWYDQFLLSERGIEWIEWFDNNFPNHKAISDIKKIDFIIFALPERYER